MGENLFLAAAVTFFATSLGAIFSILFPSISDKKKDLLLGLSAGVMLAATCFSLLLPALELVGATYSPLSGATLVALTLLLGAFLIYLANEFIPHEHFFGAHEGRDAVRLKKIWLFVLAITIHNVPEGLAVGVAAGSNLPEIFLPVVIGIGFQDIPEGFVVAVALLAYHYKLRLSLIHI